MSYSLSSQVTSNQTLFSLCNQRKNQRYYTSQGSSIELITDVQNLTKSLKGMIVDDSFSGCGLIIVGEEKLSIEQLCYLKIQGIEPILCKVIWFKSVDKNLIRLGIEYIIKQK
ncbi:MAG: PilZ domain-containing protein [Crocosphaera sp.]|jgi:hypothetical protein